MNPGLGWICIYKNILAFVSAAVISWQPLLSICIFWQDRQLWLLHCGWFQPCNGLKHWSSCEQLLWIRKWNQKNEKDRKSASHPQGQPYTSAHRRTGKANICCGLLRGLLGYWVLRRRDCTFKSRLAGCCFYPWDVYCSLERYAFEYAIYFLHYEQFVKYICILFNVNSELRGSSINLSASDEQHQLKTSDEQLSTSIRRPVISELDVSFKMINKTPDGQVRVKHPKQFRVLVGDVLLL